MLCTYMVVGRIVVGGGVQRLTWSLAAAIRSALHHFQLHSCGHVTGFLPLSSVVCSVTLFLGCLKNSVTRPSPLHCLEALQDEVLTLLQNR